MLPEKLIINLCPTGMVPRQRDFPELPVQPKEIALDVKRCYELGISIVHIHARDANESPTWLPEVFREIIHEIKYHCPEIIICVTTSGRDWSELDKRSAALYLKNPAPEMGSLTLGSMNFASGPSVNAPDTIQALAKIMLEQGVKPELEIFEIGMINYAHYLIKKGILQPPYYFNLLLGSLGTASLNASNIGLMIDSLPENSTWALAGIGRAQHRANTIAIALGGHVRIGMEDNPYYNWHTREQATNPRLVERVVKIAKSLGRELATPVEAKAIMGLN